MITIDENAISILESFLERRLNRIEKLILDINPKNQKKPSRKKLPIPIKSKANHKKGVPHG